MTIETTRPVLRPWTDQDRRPFAEMCDDPAFIEYLMPFASREASNTWIDRQMAHLAAHGFCFLAVEAKENAGFVGAVGLLRVGYEAHFTPALEIGWRVSGPAGASAMRRKPRWRQSGSDLTPCNCRKSWRIRPPGTASLGVSCRSWACPTMRVTTSTILSFPKVILSADKSSTACPGMARYRRGGRATPGR
jgi:hypothetical protein